MKRIFFIMILIFSLSTIQKSTINLATAGTLDAGVTNGDQFKFALDNQHVLERINGRIIRNDNLRYIDYYGNEKTITNGDNFIIEIKHASLQGEYEDQLNSPAIIIKVKSNGYSQEYNLGISPNAKYRPIDRFIDIQTIDWDYSRTVWEEDFNIMEQYVEASNGINASFKAEIIETENNIGYKVSYNITGDEFDWDDNIVWFDDAGVTVIWEVKQANYEFLYDKKKGVLESKSITGYDRFLTYFINPNGSVYEESFSTKIYQIDLGVNKISALIFNWNTIWLGIITIFWIRYIKNKRRSSVS